MNQFRQQVKKAAAPGFHPKINASFEKSSGITDKM